MSPTGGIRVVKGDGRDSVLASIYNGPGKGAGNYLCVHCDIFALMQTNNEIASLRTEFRNVLDKTSKGLLALTIKARENIDADLQ